LKKRAYIGLGSNMDLKQAAIDRACKYIKQIEGVNISKISSLYATKPWGKTDQEDFINQVIEVETELSPLDLLHHLQNIEIKMGRHRYEKWGPRIIDLDILLYEGESMLTEELSIPHPFMLERLFVLVPLAEIDPEIIFADGTSIGEVLNRVVARDGSQIIKKL